MYVQIYKNLQTLKSCPILLFSRMLDEYYIHGDPFFDAKVEP